MGIFDRNDEDEEVAINPNENNSLQKDEKSETRLESEVESKVVNKDQESDDKVSSVASGSTVSNKGSKKADVSLGDVYRQNERIIELLEEISGKNEKNEEDDSEINGDLDGVL